MTKELRRAQPSNSTPEISGEKTHSINLALNNTNARLRNDLTILKQHVAARNQQFQQQCQFNDAIMDIAAAPIVVIDADQRLIRFSKSCEMITGHDFKKFIGTTHWWKLVPVEDRKLTESVFDRLRDNEQAITHENHWLNADGSRRNLSWSTTVMKDTDDNTLYFVMTGIDITRQRRAELDAHQQLKIASRLQRIQPTNELTTLLAHELNQPLAAIAMYAESGQKLLIESPSAMTQLDAVLKQVSEQSVRAGEIIRRLRAFISHDEITLIPVDLNTLVEHAAITMATSALKSGIDLEVNADKSIPEVMV
jgi:PAS domain S-box-containing protein